MRDCPQCQTQCDETHKFCPSCGFPIGKVVQSDDDPLIGRTLPGGHLILELVGVGGMGRVYRAEQTTLNRTVAVKIIHPHLVGEENATARFMTESRAASRLNHPNSVVIYDFGKTPDEQLYLVMEFLRGRDLARVDYEEGPLSFARIVNVLRQVLAALSEAHHLNIIHRDLKPENIILEPVRQGGDFVKVVDFGLAKMRAPSEKSITSPGIVCGTPEYMSPEQGRGDPLDARSDLYGVGVILYQLLTGRLPFEADSPTQVVLMHISDPAPDPRTVAPERGIPQELVDVLNIALAKDSSQRFANADEFSRALADVLTKIEPQTRARTTAASSLVKCTSCSAMNPATQKFCGECGNALVASSPSGPSARGSGPALGSSAFPKADPATGVRRLLDDRVRSPLPLTGRDEELAWLEAKRSAERATLACLQITGEPGVGKTRLLQEFVALASTGGDAIVAVLPDPSWAEVGYFAVRRAISGLARLPPGGGSPYDWGPTSPEVQRGLMETFAIDVASQPRVSPRERRLAVAEALGWAITRAGEHADGRSVIIAVDDFNHIDGVSRNAFCDVLLKPPAVKGLLVVTSTPGFAAKWPADAVEARALRGLTAPMVTKLLQAVGATQVPAADGRPLAPLYIEQFLRFTREQGGPVPPRLADLIALRVERLPPHARRVLQAVAVYGDDATEDIVLRLLQEPTDVRNALTLLARADMVEKTGSFDDPFVTEEGLRTTHPLLREVVLATIPAAVRRALHAHAAQVCEEAGAELEIRALHEHQAQNAFQALILLESLSARCTARGDEDGTISLLRRGLELARRELVRGELDDPLRAVLIFSKKLGEALAAAGDFTEADGILREALDIVENGDDRARVLGALASVEWGRERRAEAVMHLREASDLAQRSGAQDLIDSLDALKRRICV